MKVYPHNTNCNSKIKKASLYITGKIFKIYCEGIKQGLEKLIYYHLQKRYKKEHLYWLAQK